MSTVTLHHNLASEESNCEHLSVGKSRFADDIWDLSDLIPQKSLADHSKKICFTYINNQQIKVIAKLYAYSKLANIKPQTVVKRVECDLRPFIKYADAYGINSFAEVNRAVFLHFNSWLKNDYIIENGRNAGNKISNKTSYRAAYVVEEIVKLGQDNGWNVCKDIKFNDINSSGIWLVNEKTKEETLLNKVEPIPEEVFDKILYYAINKESIVQTKCGIIIQSQTGLRISEVLSIQEGCVKTTNDGYDCMEIYISKTEKGPPTLHRIFINELVKSAIKELDEQTRGLRLESGLKELFISKHKSKISVITGSNFNRVKLKNFIRRWDIRDKNGDLYPLHSHQFRATYVRELIKRKVPIGFIMKHFDHISIEMTAHYLTLQQEEVKKIYGDMILSPESKIAGLNAGVLKEKLEIQFRGKTDKEVKNIIDDLSSSMSFNPLPTGVCLYDFRRGNCTDGDGCFFYNCPNYITEVKFYPVLKKELELMESEMLRLKEIGRERDWQRQYIKWNYLKPLVDSLEVQIHGT